LPLKKVFPEIFAVPALSVFAVKVSAMFALSAVKVKANAVP